MVEQGLLRYFGETAEELTFPAIAAPTIFPMTRATRPILDIRGLVVHRDGTLILDRLDWRVQRGEQALERTRQRRPDLLPPERVASRENDIGG